jgi:hypothetical protein
MTPDRTGSAGPTGPAVRPGSDASNLTPAGGDDLSAAFVRDRRAGRTVRVTPLNRDWQSETESIFLAKLSANGRSALVTTAATLVAEDTGGYDVFVRDLA